MIRAALCASLLSTALAAQNTTCTHHRCALSYANGDVVQGPPPLAFGAVDSKNGLLEFSSGPVRDHFLAARRYEFLGNVFAIIAAGAAIGAGITYPSRDEHWTPANRVWLPGTAVAAVMLTTISGRRGEEHLRKSVWLYNRESFGCSPDRAIHCEYDASALRVRRGMWSRTIVRASSDTSVARIGYRAPPVADFAAAGDSAKVEYEAFRVRHASRATADRIVYGSLAGASALFLSSHKNETTRVAALSLYFIAYMGGHHSMWDRMQTERHLDRAIWFHNSALVPNR